MGGDYYFSKIETFDRDELTNSAANRKRKRKEERRTKRLENLGIFVGKSVKLLKKARQFDEYASKLKQENQEKAVELNQRRAWQLAHLKAQGVKVKSDLSMIRRSASKAMKLKQKSSNKWQERNRKVQEERDVKQRKRQRNLQRRRDAKAAKKYKRMCNENNPNQYRLSTSPQ
ncbi:hypothetical protein TcWFU_007160 [Taenia crassiceps]|uniref:Ribosomal RNA-processing protein 14/surfeit locus protein 6 C-terminal domain-containing protein n=1 Tax=Taenia crassiceps TaxID=6207 RepID=A0ABR4QHY9_9CEST